MVEPEALPCVHHLIERQVARTPDATAVESDAGRLTYGQLDAAAARLATHLRADRGVAAEEPVGLLADRSLEMTVAVLGILKAGAAFVPLEPAHPPAWVAAMIAGAGIRVLVATGRAAGRPSPPGFAGRTVCLDRLDRLERLGGTATAVRPAPVFADSLAYVMHTSGSTGVPKGVLVPHAGLANYLLWCCEAYDARTGRGSAVQSPITTSMIFPSLFAPLCVGGAVTLLDEEAGLDGLAVALRDPAAGPFSFLKVTPSQLRLLEPRLAGADLASRVGTLVIGAEPLDEATVAPWRERAPGTRLVNEYGPTETVVGRTVHVLPAQPHGGGPVPIGRPIANTRIHLVDDRLDAVVPGAAGEICIAGAGLARGYAGRPALTAEAFVPDPFSPRPGARMYRTGDVGRLLDSGDLVCLGRRDDQVKVRGYRVEPGDVAAALRAHPAVGDAFVTARRRDADGALALVAYVAVASAAPAAEELRAFVRERLPEHMVPAAFVVLAAIPTTAGGKVDRAGLPPPPAARPDLAAAFAPPRDGEERAVAGMWADLLGVAEVGVHDDFLDLGGDSLLAGRLQARLSEHFGVDLTLADVLTERTVAAQVGCVRARLRDGGRRGPVVPPLRPYRPAAAGGGEAR